ncbi:MAG: M1 family metallopeptidase [Labilithrix sp.]|nr:M1 family metallopeptidase [Labilithrix sp.]MCW5811353.1 M1 family metallopeptidase [Labilithrix sp.]
MTRAFVCLATLAAAVACGASPAPDRAVTGDDAEIRFRAGAIDEALPEVDALGYEVELAVDDTPNEESFRATVTGTYVATEDLTELTLDLDGNEIDDVSVGARPAEHTRDGATLRVTLPEVVKRGSTFSTRIAYHGAIRQADGQDPDDFAGFGGFMVKQKNTDGARIFTTLSWPSKARRWLPLRDHPRDAAMVTFAATFPATFTVLANGKHVRTDDAPNGRTWRYEALTPMPTYDFHVAAYEGWNVDRARSASKVPIASYTYASGKPKAKSIFGDLGAALDYFEGFVGPYRWGTATFIQEPIFGGGMEHASVVSMDETLFVADDPKEARAVAFHELAHHWSGNLVHFRRWNDLWLSEGFTEYLTARAIARLDGAEAGKAHWRGYLSDVLKQDKVDPHPLAPAGEEIDVLEIFDSIPYAKGALTVRMLEQIVGEAAWAKFLRGWFDRHGFGKAVDTEQLRSELEAETKKDLRRFFETFVRGEGHPELKVSYASSGDDDGVDVTIEQLQTTGPAGGFAFPLELDLVREDGATERVVIDLTTPKVTRHFATKVKTVVADPDELALAVVGCGQTSPLECKPAYRCSVVRSGFSACLPRLSDTPPGDERAKGAP